MALDLNKARRNAMAKIAASLPTTSAKIRALGEAGYRRTDIASFLNIRYQHVRNVELQAKKKAQRQQQPPDNAALPAQTWVQVGADGRVVIPAAFRRVLGIDGGGPVFMLWEGAEIRLLSRDGALARVQAMAAPYLTDESSSVAAFLAERRREARREERRDRRGG